MDNFNNADERLDHFSTIFGHVTHVTNLLLLGVNHLMEPIIKLNKRCS